MEIKERCHVQISHRFAALKVLDHNVAWEGSGENMKVSPTESIGYLELKEHKPWFDDTYSELLARGNEHNLQ
jgi:hypothetical protein